MIVRLIWRFGNTVGCVNRGTAVSFAALEVPTLISVVDTIHVKLQWPKIEKCLTRRPVNVLHAPKTSLDLCHSVKINLTVCHTEDAKPHECDQGRAHPAANCRTPLDLQLRLDSQTNQKTPDELGTWCWC